MQNQEADDLTNDEFRHFDPKKRIKVDLKDLKFKIMDQLFEVGDAYTKELEAARSSEKRKAEARKRAGGAEIKDTQRKGKSLRETDPWG